MKIAATTIFAVFLIAAATMTSCHRKAADKVQQEQPVTDIKTDPEPPAAEPAPEAYQFVGYQKTPCYGMCPVYEVKINTDGKATWVGRMNVERTGRHEARVGDDVLKRIREKIHEVRFLDFENQYPVSGPRIADLPSTIIYVRIGDMEKIVHDTHDAPADLKDFEKFMEKIIAEIPWQPSDRKD